MKDHTLERRPLLLILVRKAKDTIQQWLLRKVHLLPILGYMLKILNSFYREIITNSREDDFEKKLNSLLSTSIFKDVSKLVVMPLVSTI